MITLNLDIVDEVIKHSDDDLLLTLSEVSQYFCQRSRRITFQTISFGAGENRRCMDQFLDLVGHPQTTIASAVQSLQYHNLHPYLLRDLYARENITQLAQKLVNLTSLRIDCLYGPGGFIDDHVDPILSFMKHLPATRVAIACVLYTEAKELIQLWNHLPQNTRILTLYDVKIIPELLSVGAITEEERSRSPPLPRPDLLFDFIDSTSLTSLQEIGLFKNQAPTSTLDKFHLRFYSESDNRNSASVPIISKFLSHTGPALKHLTVDLNGSYTSDAVALYAPLVDFSNCTSLQTASVGIVELGDGLGNAHLKDTMWTALSCLPTPSSIQNIHILFCIGSDQSKLARVLQSYSWSELASRLRKMFIRLSTLKITLGSYDKIDGMALDNYFNLHIRPQMESVARDVNIVLQSRVWLNMNYSSRLRGPDFLLDADTSMPFWWSQRRQQAMKQWAARLIGA